MNGADEPVVPPKISFSEAQNMGLKRTIHTSRLDGRGTQVNLLTNNEVQPLASPRHGWVRPKIRHMEIVWGNKRIPINLFNVLAAIFWFSLSVLAVLVIFLYLNRPY